MKTKRKTKEFGKDFTKISFNNEIKEIILCKYSFNIIDVVQKDFYIFRIQFYQFHL